MGVVGSDVVGDVQPWMEVFWLQCFDKKKKNCFERERKRLWMKEMGGRVCGF